MKTRQRMPNLNNYSASAIVDECAPLQEHMNQLKKLTDYYKAGLKSRLTPEMRIDALTYEVVGEHYAATISESTRTGMSADKVRTFIQEMLDKGHITEEPDIYNTSETITVRFTQLAQLTK